MVCSDDVKSLHATLELKHRDTQEKLEAHHLHRQLRLRQKQYVISLSRNR